MTDGIKDKVVVVTGASSGLGAETARHLAKAGAKLVLGARLDGSAPGAGRGAR
jgi:NADP-dependent 3-hydroxy acid dehydrogenase YdfG